MNAYHRVAPFYDWILRPFISGIRRDVLGIVQNLKTGRILDVCCGTGDQLRLFQQNGIEALGIDLSTAMLKVAGKGKRPVKCLMQDATNMAFQSQSFDLAIVSFALHETEWENARLIIEEIRRVLKPGGNVLIVDYALNPNSSSMSKVAIYIIEYLAGKRHYGNFKCYCRRGGLDQLIDPKEFTPVQSRFHGQCSIVIKMLQKNLTA